MGYLIYLAGPIAGGSYDEAVDWRAAVADMLPEPACALSPMRAKEFFQVKLGPQGIFGGDYDHSGLHSVEVALTTDRGITARDRNDVRRCDLVLANFLHARQVSAGTCIELGWADAWRKPVVAIMEPTGNPHDHPMVRDLIGFRTGSVEEAIEVAMTILRPE